MTGQLDQWLSQDQPHGLPDYISAPTKFLAYG